jgi:hypothetical protein
MVVVTALCDIRKKSAEEFSKYVGAIATACHGSLSILPLSKESCKDLIEIIVEFKGDNSLDVCLCSSGHSTHKN